MKYINGIRNGVSATRALNEQNPSFLFKICSQSCGKAAKWEA